MAPASYRCYCYRDFVRCSKITILLFALLYHPDVGVAALPLLTMLFPFTKMIPFSPFSVSTHPPSRRSSNVVLLKTDNVLVFATSAGIRMCVCKLFQFCQFRGISYIKRLIHSAHLAPFPLTHYLDRTNDAPRLVYAPFPTACHN